MIRAETARTMVPEPITAEIVPPLPSPWRFGLKALLGLMAVCSVQFAAMSYLGVLAGLAIGVLVCFVAFTAIIVIGPLLSGERARALPQLEIGRASCRERGEMWVAA